MIDHPFDTSASDLKRHRFRFWSKSPANETVIRPVGVTLLAWWHILIGIVLLSGQFLYYSSWLPFLWGAGDSSSPLDQQTKQATISVLGLSLWIFLTGIGLIQGAKWGWWLACGFYLLNCGLSVSALIMIFIESNSTFVGLIYELFKNGGRLILSFLILYYFLMSDHVTESFSLSSGRTELGIWAVTGICLALLILLSIIEVGI